MKSYLPILFFAFLLFAAAPSSEFDTSLEYAKESYDGHRLELSLQLENFSQLLSEEVADKSELIEVLRSLRNSWKKLEHFACFFEGEFVRFYINGAPLPRTQYRQDSLSVFQPEGLQLLDEMMAEDRLDRAEVLEVVDKLQARWAELSTFEDRRRFNKRKILLAIRAQVLRIATMGITGFDTPGSLNGIEESRISLEALKAQIESFQELNATSATLQRQVLLGLEGSITYLHKNGDFEALDRVHFLREFLQPIYGDLLDFHQALELKTFSTRGAQEEAINYQARRIFDQDFLNPYYFTVLREEQDSDEMRALGALLFYDPVLSNNNQMSCSSCHHPNKAFAEDLAKSRGNKGNELSRNAPALLNSIYASKQFWDLRADKLEAQTNNVIDNSEEFHTDFTKIAEKLSGSIEYQERFESAFEYAMWSESKIDQYTISTALASYVLSLKDWNAPFDQYMRGERNEIEQEVKDGFNLFMGKAACATCHFPPTFAGLVPPEFHENETEVLGVPSDTTLQELDADPGRIESGRPMDKAEHYRHSFKTVTLRNVELTAPYMHNGVYETLEEVVEFYDHGGGAGAGLEVPYQTLSADSLHLSTAEKAALVSFMKSLTSEGFLPIIPDELPAFPSSNELHKLPRNSQY